MMKRFLKTLQKPFYWGILALALLNHFTTKSAYGQVDTSAVIPYEQFIQNVLKNHPEALQAQLKEAEAKAEMRRARGNFDPIFSSGIDQKSYDDKLYYRLFESELRVPTRLGVDLVGSYGQSSGEYVNPENRTGTSGLWNGGIEINVLQGLLMDEGRTDLRQAKTFQFMAQNQQQLILNDLIFGATEAYLKWQQAHASLDVVLESIDIAATYFENTKTSFLNGEQTAVDTLEASIILQDRENFLQSAKSALLDAERYLENFLWDEGDPDNLEDSNIPQPMTLPLFDKSGGEELLDSLPDHPMIQEKVNQQAIYEASQRLKREKLLPKLKLKYMPLLTPTQSGELPSYTRNDYKWGFSFAFPLLIRKERGEYQQSKIKVRSTELEIENKRNELYNYALNSLNQLSILEDQVKLQEQNVQGYAALLEAENEKFNFGESSVFLINKRQEKLLEGELKLIELQVKRELETLKYFYYTNNLMD